MQSSLHSAYVTGNAEMHLFSCSTLSSKEKQRSGTRKSDLESVAGTPAFPTPGLDQALGPSQSPWARGARRPKSSCRGPLTRRQNSTSPGRPGSPLPLPPQAVPPHTVPTPPRSLPRTPAASSTYCLKPRPPPRPKPVANKRAPNRRHHVGAGVSPAASSVSNLWNPDYATQDAPRELRPYGQCSSFVPGVWESGWKGSACFLRQCVSSPRSRVRGPYRSGGRSFNHT